MFVFEPRITYLEFRKFALDFEDKDRRLGNEKEVHSTIIRKSLQIGWYN
jgi:hypothetical protein